MLFERDTCKESFTVFGAILTGRESGQKLQCLYENPMANNTQFLNRNVKILSGILYSPSLKDVAWLERAQLIFLVSHTYLSVNLAG